MTCREVDVVIAQRDSRARAVIRAAVEDQLPMLGRFDIVRRSSAGDSQVVVMKDHANQVWAVGVVSPSFGFGNEVESPVRPVTVDSVRTYHSLSRANAAHDASVELHRGMRARRELAGVR
jgi:hypothetical protein